MAQFNNVTIALLQQRLAHARTMYPEMYGGWPDIFCLEDLYRMPRTAKDDWTLLSHVSGGCQIFHSGGTSGGGLSFVPVTAQDLMEEARILARLTAQTLPEGAHLFSSIVTAGGGWAGGMMTALSTMTHERLIGYSPFNIEPKQMLLLTDQIYRALGSKVEGVAFVGLPSLYVKMADELKQGTEVSFRNNVHTLVYGGEGITPSQIGMLYQAFPRCRVYSLFTSSEANALGFGEATPDDTILSVIPDSCYVWIMDEETHKPVTEPGKRGMAVVTNLYSTYYHLNFASGDLLEWVEHNKTFRFVGRVANLIGAPYNVPAEPVVREILKATGGSRCQIVLQLYEDETRRKQFPDGEFKVVVESPQLILTADQLLECLKRGMPHAVAVYLGGSFNCVFESGTPQETTTGKTKLVIDQRNI